MGKTYLNILNGLSSKMYLGESRASQKVSLKERVADIFG